MNTTRTLPQTVEDWFLNSPSWPFAIDPDHHADEFLKDECPWTREDVHAVISEFRDRLADAAPYLLVAATDLLKYGCGGEDSEDLAEKWDRTTEAAEAAIAMAEGRKL